jgi:hypothetical protein
VVGEIKDVEMDTALKNYFLLLFPPIQYRSRLFSDSVLNGPGIAIISEKRQKNNERIWSSNPDSRIVIEGYRYLQKMPFFKKNYRCDNLIYILTTIFSGLMVIRCINPEFAYFLILHIPVLRIILIPQAISTQILELMKIKRQFCLPIKYYLPL